MPSKKVVGDKTPHANKRLIDLTVSEYLELQRWIDNRARTVVRVSDIKAIQGRARAIDNIAKLHG